VIPQEQRLAHRAVSRAVRDGVLIRPTSCQDCGDSPNKIVAHHHMGYSEEHHLSVQWLCTRCHEKAHGTERGKRAAAGRQAALSPERRSEISRKAGLAAKGAWKAKSTPEERSAMARERYARLTPEQKEARNKKIAATRIASNAARRKNGA
jgi:hypothetical protein